MVPPSSLIAFAPPSETALLDFARGKVTSEMIHEICLHDWERDIELHEAALLKQLTPDPVLGLLPWHPREVLELERWEEPDEPWNDRPPTGMTGHAKRLFACTILLRNVAFVSGQDWDGEMEFFIAISAVTVLRLLKSSVALGGQTPRLGIGFLLWLHEKQNHPMLRPFVAFGVLLLQIQQGLLANLLDTCTWVEEDEKLAREQQETTDNIHSARWLVGLNYQEDSGDHPKRWADSLGEAIAAGSAAFPAEVESTLRKMSERLSYASG